MARCVGMSLYGSIEAGGTKFICAVGTGPENLRAQAGFPTTTPKRNYGHVTTTPKVGWGNADIVGPLHEALGVPVGFDTDVNSAVLGEARWGAAQGLGTAVYVTIGTGIGGGALVGGQLAHGLVHPEMGHLLVPREPDDLEFAGDCPFHGARCWGIRHPKHVRVDLMVLCALVMPRAALATWAR